MNIMSKNVFYRGITENTKKYITKFNYYSQRLKQINRNMINKVCPKHWEKEDYEYILIFYKVENIRDTICIEIEEKFKEVETYNIN